MNRIFAGAIAVVGWLSLILQFVLAMINPIEPEPGAAERFVRFFSYFTVLTNIIVAATTTAIAFFPAAKLGRFASRPTVRCAVAVYISIVGLVYSLFLRSVWDPQGWQSVADHALHDAIPLAYVLYWLTSAPKDGISWIEPLKWLVYPLTYMAYSFARGAVAMWYPYWFVDVTQLGYSTALTNSALVLTAFVVVGAVYVVLAKLLRSDPAGRSGAQSA
ncbi:MAG: Pr6Pr family membrane protein [Pyrinomonadaceae bacterium]|nr:Pr6Pr family membrane protein [Pyrinomonadaceae bacterium]